eukprot:365590-Chlamydomonas_euryale.AAC.2
MEEGGVIRHREGTDSSSIPACETTSRNVIIEATPSPRRLWRVSTKEQMQLEGGRPTCEDFIGHPGPVNGELTSGHLPPCRPAVPPGFISVRPTSTAQFRGILLQTQFSVSVADGNGKLDAASAIASRA